MPASDLSRYVCQTTTITSRRPKLHRDQLANQGVILALHSIDWIVVTRQ